MSSFNVWKTINLGVDFSSNAQMGKVFQCNKIKLGKWILARVENLDFGFAECKMPIRLVRARVSDLCTGCGSVLGLIYSQALSNKLKLCETLEVACQLRWQYKDQPKGERLWIASQTVINDDRGHRRTPNLLCVENRNGNLLLNSGCGRPSGFFSSATEFIFVAT